MVTRIQATVTRKLRLETFGWAEFNATGGELPRVATVSESSSIAMKLQRLNNGKSIVSGDKTNQTMIRAS